MEYILLFIWFVLLIKWADILVDGASSIAKRFWISNLVIWLTIVAFWTSAPELVVSMMSAFSWNADLAISNVLWSNISNILLILWITALLYPVRMPHSTVKKEIPFAIFISILIFILLSDVFLWIDTINQISRVDALLLAFFFWFFLYYTFKNSKQEKESKESKEDEIPSMSSIKSSVFIIWWLAWLIYWWNLIVDNAVLIAQSYWLPNSFIWVTIIAIWTSLPELATSVIAALKKNTDMAIWWIIWSNIFNTLWILWASWIILPLQWYNLISIDLTINLLATIILVIFAVLPRKYFIERRDWALLVILYISYISYLIYSL